MVTMYATADHWEAWQQAYQFGLLLIFPPEPVLSQVNALRATYDPQSHATCAAHITLTVPLARPMHETDWHELQALVSQVPPFAIQYGPLRHYLPYPGVCLTIEPQETLNALVQTLERASVFAESPARRWPFSAHMTIAEFISVEQTEQLMTELAERAPSGNFTCTGVSYAIPDAQFRFSQRRKLAFGTATPTGES